MRHHDSYVTGPVRLCGSAREPVSTHLIDPTGTPVGHRYDISFCYATPDMSSKSYAIKTNLQRPNMFPNSCIHLRKPGIGVMDDDPIADILRIMGIFRNLFTVYVVP